MCTAMASHRTATGQFTALVFTQVLASTLTTNERFDQLRAQGSYV